MHNPSALEMRGLRQLRFMRKLLYGGSAARPRMAADEVKLFAQGAVHQFGQQPVEPGKQFFRPPPN